MVFDCCVDFLLCELFWVLILDNIHASLAITEWSIFRELTATEVHSSVWELLIDLEFKWLEACAEVR